MEVLLDTITLPNIAALSASNLKIIVKAPSLPPVSFQFKIDPQSCILQG